MVGAVACGCCAAVIWVAASSYISSSAEDEHQKNQLFGVFGACALGSHLFGNMSTVLLLHYFDHLVYFGLLFGLAILSALLLLLLKPVIQKEKENPPSLKDICNTMKKREII